MHTWELAGELGVGANPVSAAQWILKIKIEIRHTANIISLIDLYRCRNLSAT
jgi:hypothetical protein